MANKDVKIKKIYKSIIDRLPSTYPCAELVIHNSVRKLREYYTKTEGKESGDPPCAFCDVDNNTIHVPLDLNYISYSKKNVPCQFAEIILHEIGHLYAHGRYGIKDLRWKDYVTAERYADRFACRWLRRLKKEGFFKHL